MNRLNKSRRSLAGIHTKIIARGARSLLAACFLFAAPAVALADDGAGPLTISKIGNFFVGGQYVDTEAGQVFAGQAYVEYFVPEKQTHPYPIIFIEGCCQAGAGYMGTPDGRDGWGQYFLSKGYAVYIMDQVGRGRSPYIPSVYGPAKFNTREEVEEYSNTDVNSYPQAKLHTQWPSPGTLDDPIYGQFLSSFFPNQSDRLQRETLNRDAIIAILDKIGPSILAPHSQSAAPVWLATDARPNLVKALLMVEAGSSSFYDVDFVGPPTWFKDGGMSKPFGLTRTPLTYDPPVTGFEDFVLEEQDKPDGPDVARCWEQKEPAKKLVNFENIPTLQMSAEASFGAPTANCNAMFLKSAGVPVDFVRLADIGIHGNGHFVMAEKNNMEIAAVIADWLNKRVTPLEATAK